MNINTTIHHSCTSILFFIDIMQTLLLFSSSLHWPVPCHQLRHKAGHLGPIYRHHCWSVGCVPTPSGHWTERQNRIWIIGSSIPPSLLVRRLCTDTQWSLDWKTKQDMNHQVQYTAIIAGPQVVYRYPVVIGLKWKSGKCINENLQETDSDGLQIYEILPKRITATLQQLQTRSKLDMCLWNTDAPGSNKVKIWENSLSPTFWPCPTSKGHVMSVKCEEPIDDLTIQVWLLYHHPNFKYCTLFVSGTELRTNRRTIRQTDGQTNGRTIRLLDVPGGPSRPGHKKITPTLQQLQNVQP